MKVTKVLIALAITTLTASAYAGLPGSIIIDEPVLSKVVVSAELESINIDPLLQQQLPMAVDAATITVDYVQNTATLAIIMNVCPEGAFCLVGPTIEEVTLPIISVSIGACNITTIVAEKNQMPVDGARNTLTITDAAAATCDMLFIPTTVDYEVEYYDRMGSKTVLMKSTFSSSLALVPVEAAI